jgi:hypothetical protein
MTFARAPRAGTARSVATAVGLVLLLAGHYALRRHADSVIPMADRAFYPRHYAVAISLVAGRGFRGFDLTGEQASWPEAPTVLKFLDGGKADLRAGRLKVFLDTARGTPPPPEAYVRVLDLHVAALLWRAFGIDWSVLFVFYGLVSTSACLGVFLLARHLGGAAAGFLAAVLFSASPFEAAYSAYSIRDLSPLWFAVFTFAAAAAAARVRRPGGLLAAAAAAGVVATLGVGWRPDCILLPPFAVLLLAASLAARRTPPRRIAAAVLLLALASAATWTWIARLAGGDVRRPPTIGFHIAAYGSHTRSNILDYENSFLAARDDTQTYFTVAHFAEAASGRRPLVYGGAEYARECRRLFLAMARSEGYRWLAGFPRFYRAALDALGDAAGVQSIPASDLPRLRPAWSAAPFLILDPLTRALPGLFAAGAVVALAAGRDRVLAATLAAFSLAYAAALLMVLPESKHFGPMLLPLAVLGAQVVNARGMAGARRPGRRAVAAAAAGAIAVGVLALAARAIAAGDRGAYLAEARARVAAPPAATVAVEPQRAVGPWRAPGDGPDPVALVVEVDPGAAPGDLLLRQERGRDAEPSPRAMITRHALPRGRRATFFATALQGGAYGDIRSHRCVVEVGGTAVIAGARLVALGGWSRPLFATVLEDAPGNPRLRPGPLATRLVNIGAPAD